MMPIPSVAEKTHSASMGKTFFTMICDGIIAALGWAYNPGASRFLLNPLLPHRLTCNRLTDHAGWDGLSAA